MKKLFRLCRRVTLLAATAALFVALAAPAALGATWKNLEPLKSSRADVERALGAPIGELPNESGALRFKVAGGTVVVVFVDAKFVAAHKLQPELVGTVRQIVLQHDRAPDTPESIGVAKNSNFKREERGAVVTYRNQHDGLAYTFINGKLKTTYYTAAADVMARAQKGGTGKG